MNIQSDNLATLLQPFGLEEDEVLVYVELLQKGRTTALNLSKNLKISRTKIYRILDDLEDLNLVVAIRKKYGTTFEAASIDNLKRIVSEKEKEYKQTKEALPAILEKLASLSNQDSSKSKVVHYYGEKGLRRVVINQARAKGKLRYFTLEEMDKYLNFEGGDDNRLEYVKNKVYVYELTNKKYMVKYTNVVKFVRELWEIRHIDPSDIDVEYEFAIYNDVVAIYGFDGVEPFCVEMYNEKIANTQAKMFDFMFKYATPMKVLNDHGEAEVIS